MLSLLSLFSPSRRRRLNAGRLGPRVSAYESRLLLTAGVAAEVACAGRGHHAAAKGSSAKQEPGNYSGYWQIQGEGTHYLIFVQNGTSITGYDMQSSFVIGTITGTVKGNKLKAEVVGSGYSQSYKVSLTDETHFEGTRKSIVGGVKQKKERVTGTHVGV